ncbi:MAG TPA: hypothetical protein VFS21_01405, partial [Roseiflexaceae bacterium]|nr:hypothetical protein [Roseiflexaceae bacterium]
QLRVDAAHARWQAQLLDEAGEVAGELRLQVGAAALIVLDLRVAPDRTALTAAMIAAVQAVYPERPVQIADAVARPQL